MRIIASIVVFLLFIAGCSNPNKESYKKYSKDRLVALANNNDIKAMISLNKYYNFPETKEGLKYYKKWYKQINNTNDAADIFNFSQVFYKYRSMFINGDDKYLKLLEVAKDKGNVDALLYIYFSNAYKSLKKEMLEKEIEKKVPKEKLEKYYLKYKEKNYNTLANDIKKIMLKKGFTYKKFDTKRLEYKLYSKRLKESYFKELLASNDLINIYETANLFMYKTTIYKNKATLLYKKALKLTKDKKILGNIYETLAYYELDKLKNKTKAIEYYKKGVDLKDKDCTFALLKLFQKDSKDFKKYISLKEHLLQTFEGKKIYAYHLYNRFSDSQLKSLKYFDELAEKGDKDSIVLLASQYISRPNYGFVPEAFKLSQKWQNYILDSDDSELFEKMRLKLSGYINKDGKKFEKELKKRKESSNNILILRDNFSTFRYRHPSKAINYAKKAIAYGDTQSSLSLASYYLNKRKEKKAIEIYKNLSNKGDKEAMRRLASFYYRGYYYQKKDLEKAIIYYEKLAKQNDIKAIKKLCSIYLLGDYKDEFKTFINIPKAIKYIKILKNLGNKTATYFLAQAYSKDGKTKDIKKAVSNYEEYSKNTNKTVAFNIAYLLYKNNKFDPNYKKALFYLKKDSKYHDLAGVNYLLGLFYEKGLGVKKDLKKASHYFGYIYHAHPYKVENLASLFFQDKDYESALFLYTISAKNRFGYYSSKMLGKIYEQGLGTKINISKALEYYKQSYKIRKDKELAEKIAKIYEIGEGEISKDIKLAKKWYRKSMSKKAREELKILRSK